jgi:hypothetical protein
VICAGCLSIRVPQFHFPANKGQFPDLERPRGRRFRNQDSIDDSITLAAELVPESGTVTSEQVMAWRRATAILLSYAAALVLSAPFAWASSCLPSASALRQEYPEAWPSWTLRASGHEGVKCWYPTARMRAHEHAIETPRVVPVDAASARYRDPSEAPAATDGVGWSLKSRATGAAPLPEESSFAQRFAAVFEKDFFGRSSLMRSMTDLVEPGATTYSLPLGLFPGGMPR